MSKAIAIIGSGTMAVAISETASRQGIESHCFSNDKNAFANGRCTEHHLIDIFDINSIVNVCKAIGINGVMATTELTVAIAAKVSCHLGLIGMDELVAERITNKGYVRSLIDDSCGIKQPKFKILENRRNLDIFPLVFPVIVKPTMLGGKRGILVANNEEEYNKAIDYAYKNMPRERQEIIIEEYLSGGREFSVESLSYRGEHKVIQVTEKITSKPPHIVELGHLQPARLSTKIRRKIEKSIPDLLKMTGVNNTSTHTELKLINDELFLIELNSRPGGDNIAYKLTELSTGYSYLGGAINIALDCYLFPKSEELKNDISGLIYVTSQTEFMKKVFDTCESFPWCVEKKKVSEELRKIVINNSRNTNYFIFHSSENIPNELLPFYS